MLSKKRGAILGTTLLIQFWIVELVYAEQKDRPKEVIQGALESFQGNLGDGIVIASLVGMLIAILRRSFKTALGCLVLVCGIVILRISISILF